MGGALRTVFGSMLLQFLDSRGGVGEVVVVAVVGQVGVVWVVIDE